MLDLHKISLPILVLVSFCIGQDLNINRTLISSMLRRTPKVNIASFKPYGEDIGIGLKFELPFVQLPIKRQLDAFGNEPALVNFNIAALASTGILTASSALASYLLRKFLVLPSTPSSVKEKERRSDNDFETEMFSMLNNIKLVYVNSSGVKVDTTLPILLSTIDETFHQNSIDLSSCLQKALCQRLQQAGRERSYEDNSTGLDKIIDGLAGMKWFQQNILSYTSLSDVVGSENDEHCDLKFLKCKWSRPVENFGNLIQTYLKFT